MFHFPENRVRPYFRLGGCPYSSQKIGCVPIFQSSYTSIRHNNIVSGFVPPMPILRPQILQLHDGYVSIDVTQIDGPAVSGDTIPVHTGLVTVIAIERVRRGRIGTPGPRIDPHPIAKQRNIRSSIREALEEIAVIRIARINLIISGWLKP